MENKPLLVLPNLEIFKTIYHKRLKFCFEKPDNATRKNTNVMVLLPFKVIRKIEHSTVKNAKNIKKQRKKN